MNEEKELWRSAAERLEAPFHETFLAEEWRRVVLVQQVQSAEQYLAAKRTGRGRRLGSRQKAQVWQAIWEFENELRVRGLWTHETVCVEAARLLDASDDKPYRHVVVDEAQDLSPWQWRLLRAAVPGGANDMFIAGDTHQRIYNSRVSLRDVGVEVTGRSSRLNLNYRTTAEILSWSLGLLKGEPIDDMEGGLDTIAGCRSDVHGLPPTLRGFGSLNAELQELSNTVADWLAAGVQPEEIGIAVRSNHLADDVVASLSRDSHAVRNLTRGVSDDSIAVGTMHRMKGLEFRCLAVFGAGENHVPPRNAITPMEDDEHTHRQDLQRERCLLFVACTRAREQLSVSWHGAPSPLLNAIA